MPHHHEHVPLLYQKFDPNDFLTTTVDSLCEILFPLGTIGNLLGLFIFSTSRRSTRISTAYTYLAISSSITNLLCLIRYASILHSYSRDVIRELVGQFWWACKIYEFSFAFRIISSWITLFWMFERLICISTKLQTFFHRSKLTKFKFILPMSLLIVILSSVIGPPVIMFEPNTITYLNVTQNYCGINSDASVKWQEYFSKLDFGQNHYTIRCLLSELTPTFTIILFNSCIVYHLIRTHRRFYRMSNVSSLYPKQSRTTSWMNLVLILHSSLFLLSLLSHIVGHWMSVEAHETWWVSLSILINCSLNFYLYCLSGSAFRNEIRRLVRLINIKKYSQNINQQYYYYYHP